MPTFAKLIGGLGLAITALIGCYFFLVLNPVVHAGKEFFFVSGMIGFLVGWRSIGFNPGLGGIASLVSGIRGAILLVVITALVFGFWSTVLKLESFIIKDLVDVLETWVDASLTFFVHLSKPRLIATFIFGGCLSGVAAGLANRFWT